MPFFVFAQNLIFSGESARGILPYSLPTRDSPHAFEMTVVTPTKRVPRKQNVVLHPKAETRWERAGGVLAYSVIRSYCNGNIVCQPITDSQSVK